MHTLDSVGEQATGLERITRPRPVKVITVTGGKGGVGKSNLAANLAVALAGLDRKVMLLDADLGLANLDVILGVQPRYNLAHVVRGECSLEDAIVRGPGGVSLVPAASGVAAMSDLSEPELAGIIGAFSELSEDLDVLIVDTAAGLTPSVTRFAQAAHEVAVVVCDEPTSITDAYALIKVLRRDHGVGQFRIVTSMTRSPGDGRALFDKMLRVTDRFLDVTLTHAGTVPWDECVQRSVQQQSPVVHSFPRSWASLALKKIAERADKWKVPVAARGNLEFFMERIFGLAGAPGGDA